MNWSDISLKTLRENPADAEMESHRLLMRGGYAKKLAPGIFSYGLLLLRSIRKFENILREELAKAGCYEILMPMVQPASIWKESGRWPQMNELLKFKNKNNHDFCLGATHEEAVVDFIRNEIKSYRDLPQSVYQIQTKYRDEIRPRFGLMRGREFIMKDAYTFDLDREGALSSYERLKAAYNNIFKKLGVDYTVVKADSGAIGGDLSNEFQVLAENGMDELLVCTSCGYSANVEAAPLIVPENTSVWTDADCEKFVTPELKTIADLSKAFKIPAEQLVKTFFVKYQNSKEKWREAALLIPGNREVNLIKVRAILKASGEVTPLSDSEVQKVTGASPGSCGPIGLKIPVYMDKALNQLNAFIVGANEDGYHLKNTVPGRDFEVEAEADLSLVEAGDPCPECGRKLEVKRGIEVGHIFYLGQKYSQPMNLQFLDDTGKAQFVEMGCYGIGVTRTLQAIVEQNHDENGIIWPMSVAPYHVHVCLLDPDDESLSQWVKVYQSSMEKLGFEVFVDDRNERPGIKFKDADLLGFPLRVVAGKRSFENDEVEMFVRSSQKKLKLPIAQALTESKKILDGLS